VHVAAGVRTIFSYYFLYIAFFLLPSASAMAAHQATDGSPSNFRGNSRGSSQGSLPSKTTTRNLFQSIAIHLNPFLFLFFLE
jgi:hypothetical protein